MERAVRSLVEAIPGQDVTVRRILFDCPKQCCRSLGICEGDSLRPGTRNGEAILVRRGDGRSVPCPADLARFIEIEPMRGEVRAGLGNDGGGPE